MISDITPSRIANAIMQDSTFNGYYLIVEGNKDYKFFNKFTSLNISIKEAWGFKNVKEVLIILEQRGFNKKIGIIDSDFSKILNLPCSVKDCFYTDFHDIEIMMIMSNALEIIVNIYNKKEKVISFFQDNDLRNMLFLLGSEIGYLKLANIKYGLGLIFKPDKQDGNQLKYKKFISEKDLSFLGEDKMIETVIDYSRGKSNVNFNKQEITKIYNRTKEKTYDPKQLVNGHDISHILFILFKKILKSGNKMLVDTNSIEDSLIMSYGINDFIRTELFNELYQWSIQNDVELFNEDVIKFYGQSTSELVKAN